MYVGGRNERVQPGMVRRPYRLPRPLDIGRHRPAQSRHRHTLEAPGNLLDSLKISQRGDRKPRFNHIHSQPLQLPRHTEFLFEIHTASR